MGRILFFRFLFIFSSNPTTDLYSSHPKLCAQIGSRYAITSVSLVCTWRHMYVPSSSEYLRRGTPIYWPYIPSNVQVSHSLTFSRLRLEGTPLTTLNQLGFIVFSELTSTACIDYSRSTKILKVAHIFSEHMCTNPASDSDQLSQHFIQICLSVNVRGSFEQHQLPT